MGKYTFEYDALNELSEEILLMDSTLKARIKSIATQIGNQLKKNTKSLVDLYQYLKHQIKITL